MTQGSGDDTKLTSEALSEKDLDNLEWARDFLDSYEKKHGLVKNHS